MLKSLTDLVQVKLNRFTSKHTDYVPAASGIAAANIKDLVRKMRTAIVKNRGSKYSQML
jgi:hypothetical protein